MPNKNEYFIFSILALLSAMLYVANMMYFRAKHKTIIGKTYKAGTREYEKLSKLSSSLGVTVAAIVILLLIVNLGFSIAAIKSDSYILLSGLVAGILSFAVLVTVGYKMLKKDNTA